MSLFALSAITAAIRNAGDEQPGGAWTPAQISTSLWLDASDSNTITYSTQPAVQEIADKSGNGRHATQSSAGSQSTWVTDSQNGLAVLHADSSDHYMIQIPSLSNADVVIVLRHYSGQFSLMGGGNTFFPIVSNDSNSEVWRGVGIPAPIVDGVSQNWTARMDAFSDLSGPQWKIFVARDITSSTLTELLRGGQNNNWGFRGEIAEVIVSMDSGFPNYKIIEGYLAHKWGLTGNLPSDHPFKNDSPAIQQDSYRSEILSDGPILYTTFDDWSGKDESGQGNQCVIAGSVTKFLPSLVSGEGKYSIGLTGSGYLILDSVASDLSSEYTLEAWVQTDNTSTGTYGLSLFIAHTSSYGNILRLLHKDEHLRLVKENGTEYQNSTVINDGKPHHIVVVASVNQTRVYVDGQEEIVLNQSISLVNAAHISFGQEYDPGGPSDYFEGLIDELVVYDFPLSPSRVLAHYNAGTLP